MAIQPIRNEYIYSDCSSRKKTYIDMAIIGRVILELRRILLDNGSVTV